MWLGREKRRVRWRWLASGTTPGGSFYTNLFPARGVLRSRADILSSLGRMARDNHESKMPGKRGVDRRRRSSKAQWDHDVGRVTGWTPSPPLNVLIVPG